MASSIGGKPPAQTFALALGVVYLGIGLIGFAVTGGDGGTLLFFEINVVHNLVHLALGVAWLIASRTMATSKSVNLVAGIALLVVAVLGFAGVLVPDLIAANAADNVLHLVTGAASVFFGTAGAATRGPAAA